MGHILEILLIAVVLSMDAFGISVIYGTLGLSKLKTILTSTIVGIYHFFMPLIGFFIGHFIIEKLPIKPNLVAGIIFFIIAIQMFLEKHDETKIKTLNIIQIILFGFSVSIDSFTVGISLNILTHKYIPAVTIFALTSAMFTLIGLITGNKINHKIGNYSKKIGASLLIILGLTYIIK